MASITHSSTFFPAGILIILTFLFILFFHGNHLPLYRHYYRLSCSPDLQVSLPPAQPPVLQPALPPVISAALPPVLSPALPPALPPAPQENGEKRKKKSSRLERIEKGLALARVAIREAVQNKNSTMSTSSGLSFLPTGPVYRNAVAFHQSYAEMEKRFKIWAYEEGERPIMHQGPLNNIYGIEGQFMEELESGLGRFKARNPDEAHAFFLPWSIAYVVHFLYRPLVTYSRAPLHHVVLDYVTLIADRHPFWNRSAGADHFMLSCHDWAPDVSGADQVLFKNMIRALCNANTSEGFRPERDISIPEVNIPMGKLGPPNSGVRISKRTTLAFFAGREHGYVRRLLFQHWKDKEDGDIRVYEYLPKNQNYFRLLGNAKFCLCPSGYEVASPRVVEAIQADCVPVLISDNYSLPFNDILDWTKFSVFVSVADIPKIKTRLQAISTRDYLRLVRGVRSVKRHFTLNRPAKPFDLTHMILHSIWLRRLNLNLFVGTCVLGQGSVH